ncbi:cytochrome c oxidase subunit 6b-1-like [Nymphaea colorata]|nr:cytochrome c oxidase subunit 6b-1-like [Nymphaea colorata]
MAEAEQKVADNKPTLLEDYFVVQDPPKPTVDSGAGAVKISQENEHQEKVVDAVIETMEENKIDAATQITTVEPVPVSVDTTPEVAMEKADLVAAADVSAEKPDLVADVVTEITIANPDDVSADESNDDSEPQETDDSAPVIKVETAPADFRFPTTNQTRHCFTRYIEYHRCIAAKGEDAAECDKFAKYYRSLCPGEWIDKWNEQRENGTFPGPL